MPYSMLSSSKNERTGRQNRRNNTKGINNTGLDNVLPQTEPMTDLYFMFTNILPAERVFSKLVQDATEKSIELRAPCCDLRRLGHLTIVLNSRLVRASFACHRPAVTCDQLLYSAAALHPCPDDLPKRAQDVV